MRYIDELVTRYPALSSVKESIECATNGIIDVFKNGGTLFLCGNGGSAADCDHIVGELRKSFVKKRRIDNELSKKLASYGSEGIYLAEHLECGLPAVNISADNALSTAYINDTSSSAVYAQALFGIAKKGDALLSISTSGNSHNCVLASLTAKAIDLYTVGLTGENGGKLAEICDVIIKAPGKETFKIQEFHLPIYHAICLECEDAFF